MQHWQWLSMHCPDILLTGRRQESNKMEGWGLGGQSRSESCPVLKLSSYQSGAGDLETGD